MNSEKLYDAITNIKDNYVEEAKIHVFSKAKNRFFRIGLIAASLVIVIGAGIVMTVNNQLDVSYLPGGTAGGSGSQEPVNGERTIFMSYAGPVFPLSVLSDSENVEAMRDITFDFTEFFMPTDGDGRSSDILVTDNYTLLNDTAEEMNIEILYPFAGSFAELYRMRPVISVDGDVLSTRLMAGSFSGGFSGFGEGELAAMQANLKLLRSWEDYSALLYDNDYLHRAFTDVSDLSQIVTVYEFSNIHSDFVRGEAPALAADFFIDFERTTVLSYFFNGLNIDYDRGFMRRSLFVPREGWPAHGENAYLIIIGDDIENLTLQGYENLGLHAGQELDDVTADVARYETNLGDILLSMMEFSLASFGRGTRGHSDDVAVLEAIDLMLLYKSTIELLTDYGALSENVAFRYETGMLEDIFQEAIVMDRVFYLSSTITIPAAESAFIRIHQRRPASFDFFGSGRNMGIYGYDMVTTLASALTFTDITANLAGHDYIEIVNQNFGFDPANGVLRVTLQTSTPHYFIEVRASRRD